MHLVPGPPPYPTHHGTRVRWSPWHPPVPTGVTHPCAHCTTPDPPYHTTGSTPRTRLLAFCCPHCHDLRLYDLGRDGAAFAPIATQGTTP